MSRNILLAAVAAGALAIPVMAQAQDVAAPAAPAASGQGVTFYPPEFFAPANPATALDMISRLPGFSLDTGSNARGFAGTGGNVLINGERPATKSDPLDEILRRTAAVAVERIELISAGAAGVDMQGRSLLANVVLKEAARVEHVLNLSTYAYPSDTYLGPTFEYQVSKSEGVNLIEGSIKAYTDRTDNTTPDGSRTRHVDGVASEYVDLWLWDRIWGGSAKGALQRAALGGKYRINVLIDNQQFERREEQFIRRPVAGEAVNTEAYDQWTYELGGQFDRRFTPDLTGEFIGLQRIETSKYGSTSTPGDSRFNEDATSGESIGRAVLRWQATPTLTLEGGGETAFNFIDSQTHYQDRSGAEDADVRVEELRGEVSGKASWRPSTTLSLEAGARLEVSRLSQTSQVASTSGAPTLDRSEEEKDLVYLKPRAVLVWSPNSSHQVRLRAERLVGQLDFGDFVASTSLETGAVDARNPDLEPSREWLYEAAYERRFWGEGALVVTYRHYEIEDAVDLIPVGAFSAPGNIGEGSQDQLQIRLTLPLARLGVPGARLQVYSSWVESSVTDPTTGAQRRLTEQVPHVCDARFTQDLRGGRWTWGAAVFCPTKEYIYRVNEIRTWETEFQAEAFLQFKPSQDLSIRLDLQNLTGRTRTRERIVFDGPRSNGRVLFVERRPVAFDPWAWIRVRKAF